MARETLLDGRMQQLEAVAASQEAAMRGVLHQWLDVAHRVGRDTLIAESLRQYYQTSYPRYRKRLNRIVEDLRLTLGHVREISILDLDNVVIASTNRIRADNIATPADKGANESDVRFSGLSVNPKYGLSGTMHAEIRLGSDLVGTAEIILAADEVVAVARNYTGLGKTGETVVARPAAGNTAELVLPLRHDPEAALRHRIAAGESDGPTLNAVRGRLVAAAQYRDYRGVEVLAALRHLSDLNYGLVAKIDLAEALQPVIGFRNALIGVGVTVAISVIILGFLLGRSIITPIHELARVAGSIRRGDLKQRAAVRSGDELEQLSDTFNQMTSQLIEANEQLESRVRRRTAQLDQANRSLEQQKTELLNSNAELQSFAYVASHDLQEPLRKLQWFGEELEESHASALDEEGQLYVKRMRDAASRMQCLIQDLLAFSQVSSGALPPQLTALDGIVEDVISDLDVVIRETGARIVRGGLPTVDADPLQMGQLFQNLLSNALKYRRTDVAPEISIAAETTVAGDGRDSDSDDLVQITIQDNGIGFDQAHAERIFEIFQRLHGRSKYSGTGIGLAICRKIVDRHGGTIQATGCRREGAKFVITLPKKQRQDIDIGTPDGGAAPSTQAGQSVSSAEPSTAAAS